MKKILMTMVAAFAAMSMNAQWYAGGGLSFTSGSSTISSGSVSMDGPTSSHFGIAPEIGMKIDDRMSIGVSLGYVSENSKVDGVKLSMGGTGEKKSPSNEFVIAPYLRYTLISWGNLSVFADAQIEITTGSNTVEETSGGTTNKTTDESTSGFSVAIVPGVSYQLNDKINLVAKLGNGLGYWNTKEKDELKNLETKTNVFGLGASTLGLSFGLYYNF